MVTPAELPHQADRRQRPRLPPARPGLHQPRLAADVPGPGLRLGRGPRLGRRHHRPHAGRGLRAVGAARRRAWAPTTATRPTRRRRTGSCGCTATPRSTCPPAPSRASYCAEVRAAAAAALDDAVALGQSEGPLGAPGYRNAQVSVIAPTGTISFMMDAQTTGIEPAIGLVSYKTLVGGGFMKLVNTDVERALRALGYDEAEQRGDPRPRGRHRLHRGRPGPGRRAPAGVRLRLRRGRRPHDRPRGPRPDDGRGAAVHLGRDQQDGQPAERGDGRGRQRHLPLGLEARAEGDRDLPRRLQAHPAALDHRRLRRRRPPLRRRRPRSPRRCAAACPTTARR